MLLGPGVDHCCLSAAGPTAGSCHLVPGPHRGAAARPPDSDRRLQARGPGRLGQQSAGRWGHRGWQRLAAPCPCPTPEQPPGAPHSSTGLRPPPAGARALGSLPAPTPASWEPRPNVSLRLCGRSGLGRPRTEWHVPTDASRGLLWRCHWPFSKKNSRLREQTLPGASGPHASSARHSLLTPVAGLHPWVRARRDAVWGGWGETTDPGRGSMPGAGYGLCTTAPAQHAGNFQSAPSALPSEADQVDDRAQVASEVPPGLAPSSRHRGVPESLLPFGLSQVRRWTRAGAGEAGPAGQRAQGRAFSPPVGRF